MGGKNLIKKNLKKDVNKVEEEGGDEMMEFFSNEEEGEENGEMMMIKMMDEDVDLNSEST